MSLFDISQRRVQPELLDELAAVDARAVAAREDLFRLNDRLGTPKILADHLRTAFPHEKPRRLIELGAGDGRFLLRLGRLLGPEWRATEAVLIDRHRCVTDATRKSLTELGWTVRIAGADVVEWLRVNPLKRDDLVLSNLFIHHFDWEPLRELLRLIADGAGHFAACEPRRWWPALMGARCLRFQGCHAVTCRDAVLSVHAGFIRRELSRVWPQTPRWELAEGNAGMAMYLFTASHRR
jgi:hypothetical protein